jgi:hypothetical protein
LQGEKNKVISDIQCRKKRNIAMTPADSLTALKSLVAISIETTVSNIEADKKAVLDSIKTITNSSTKPLVASSGLSIQYAILMGLIHDAVENIKEKRLKSLSLQIVMEEQMTKHDVLLLALTMLK